MRSAYIYRTWIAACAFEYAKEPPEATDGAFYR